MNFFKNIFLTLVEINTKFKIFKPLFVIVSFFILCSCAGSPSESEEAVEEPQDMNAQYELGLEYYKGGVDQDYEKAAELFQLAADQGHIEALFKLGEMYALGMGVPQDLLKTAELFQQAAELGHAEAQFYLGSVNEIGAGSVPQNFETAAHWYKLAAEQGHAEAQYKLGGMYDRGQGVDKDTERAAHWYRQAADQGHEEASKGFQNLAG